MGNLTSSSAQSIIPVLRRLEACEPPVTKVDLVYLAAKMNDDAAELVSQALAANPHVTHLNLSNNIGEVGAFAIARCLSKNTALQTVLLTGNHIGDAGTATILHNICLNEDSAVCTLSLAGNGLTSQSAVSIAACLGGRNVSDSVPTSLAGPADGKLEKHKQNPRMLAGTSTAIWCYKVQKKHSQGPQDIQRFVGPNLEQPQLQLPHASPVPSASTGILPLPHAHRLRSLDLDRNQIGDEGILIISRALAHNRTLEALQLSWNGITDTGIIAVSKALRHNECLVSLRLHFNIFGDAGCKALLDMFRYNHTLCVLGVDASSNKISASVDHLLMRLTQCNEGMVSQATRRLAFLTAITLQPQPPVIDGGPGASSSSVYSAFVGNRLFDKNVLALIFEFDHADYLGAHTKETLIRSHSCG